MLIWQLWQSANETLIYGIKTIIYKLITLEPIEANFDGVYEKAAFTIIVYMKKQLMLSDSWQKR